MSLFQDANIIMQAALHAALPDTAVEKALKELPRYSGKLVLIAAGKAAWQMAHAAYAQLGAKIDSGVVITKHGHAMGPIGPLDIREAGHPVPDEDSYTATAEAIQAVSGLRSDDLVLFLLSGGGSALFEKPLLPPEELADITKQLLACIDRVSLIVSEKLKSPVRCLFDVGRVFLSAKTGAGEAKDICPIDGDGTGLEIGFNNRYLMDALRYAPAERVKMELNTGISPCIITPVEGEENFLYMVLPVRLKAQ